MSTTTTTTTTTTTRDRGDRYAPMEWARLRPQNRRIIMVERDVTLSLCCSEDAGDEAVITFTQSIVVVDGGGR